MENWTGFNGAETAGSLSYQPVHLLMRRCTRGTEDGSLTPPLAGGRIGDGKTPYHYLYCLLRGVPSGGCGDGSGREGEEGEEEGGLV